LNQYDVQIMPKAQKDLDSFSARLLSRFEEAILGLIDNPRPQNSKKLSGGGSKWRVRLGDYRILYEVNDSEKIVNIYRIAHRREVYR